MNADADTTPGASPLTPTRILVPVDFTESSAEALRAAGTLARQFGAKLLVLHVTAAGTDEPAKAANVLNEFAAAHVPADIATACELGTGAPHLEIARAAAATRSDLIVISTHGHTRLADVILGSTADRVLRHAPCPVLVLRSSRQTTYSVFANVASLREVIVPTDFSAASTLAFGSALAWARQCHAELKMIYVVPETLPNDLSHLGLAIGLDQQLRKTAEAALAKLRATHFPADFPVNITVRVGVPAHEICANVEEPGSALIVMSSSGSTRFEQFCIGSVTERVVRHAQVPVLVIRSSTST